jgi:hypothetical protein
MLVTHLLTRPLGILQLVGQLDLDLLQHRQVRIQIFQLPEQVRVLGDGLLVGHVHVVQLKLAFGKAFGDLGQLFLKAAITLFN